MKKIRVLHRAATTGIGGVEKYVMNYYRFMDRNKFQFDFITRNERLAEAQEIRDLNMGVRVFTATERQDRDLLIKQVNEILDTGYEIIHMNTSIWAGFLIEELAMKRHIPEVIVHAHSTGVDFDEPEKRRFYQEMHEHYKKRFSREHATHFCACSEAAADWLFGPQIPREEIPILKNAIEVEKYCYDEEKRKKTRRRMNLDGCFVIGHIGRYSYQKNHRFLIEVFNDVYKRNNKARLMLIGQGELEKEVRKQVNDYGLESVVLHMGWQENIHELMQAMDLFLLPSRFEGLPVVLVEAQAAGLPCLASERITRETRITKHLELLPLINEIWVEKTEAVMNGYERTNMEEEITKAGYNIRFAVKELEKLYMRKGL